MTAPAFFALSVVVLAALLYWPVARLVWTLSVRRLERRSGGALGPDERRGQLRRARLISLVLVIGFSMLFNAATLGVPGGR
jgi:hypothetical protein